MRIACVFRLMSGLQRSLQNRVWDPSGSPAVYKVIEALEESEFQLSLFFTSNNSELYEDLEISLPNFALPIQILAGSPKIPDWLRRLRPYLSDLRQFWHVIHKLLQNKIDVLYTDRSNILIASLVARFTNIKVVVRVLGVTPSMQKILTCPSVSHCWYRWLYRAPFAFVLCSMDGSSANNWLQKILFRKVPREVWLNGVDDNGYAELYDSEKHPKIRILFLGRLDPLKSSLDFVNVLLQLPRDIQQKFEVDIIGEGILYKPIQDKIKQYNAHHFINLHGSVSHRDVHIFLSQSHVYISLNKQGSLSNANLEAFRAGLCLVVLEPDAKDGTDLDSLKVMPSGSVIRINRNKVNQQLAEVFSGLANGQIGISHYQQAARQYASILPSWKSRIDKEIGLLQDIYESSPGFFRRGIS